MMQKTTTLAHLILCMLFSICTFSQFTDRAEAIDEYKDNYLATDVNSQELGWTGNLATCDAGTISASSRDKFLQRLNFYRRLVGVEEVSFDPVLNEKCQKGALLWLANHDDPDKVLPPSGSWACYSQEGADAISSSMYTASPASIPLINRTNPLDFFIENGRFSWRQDLLSSKATTFGIGLTDNSFAIWDKGNESNPSILNSFVAYPPAGFIPAILISKPWTFGVPGASFENATVQIIDVNNQSLPVNIVNTLIGSAETTLVFEPDGIITDSHTDVSYTVTISGITGAPQSNYTYTTTLLSTICDKPTFGDNTTENVTSFSAELVTTPDAERHRWRFKKKTEQDWIRLDGSTAEPFKVLTDLAAETEYEWQVRKRCPNGFWSEWSFTENFTTTPLTCTAPNLDQNTTTSITTTSARMQTSIGGNQYKWRYKESIDADYTSLASTGSNVKDLVDLKINTRYNWECRRQCPNEIWSDWSGPETFFTLSFGNPLIVVTEPTANSNHIQGEQLTIRWTSQANTGNIELNLFKDDVFVWQFTPNTANDQEHLVLIPMSMPSGENYSVQVKSNNGFGSNDFSNYFSIGNLNQTISIDFPNANTTLEKGQQYEYSWSSTGAVGNVKVELFDDNTLVHTHTSNTLNDGIHPFLIPNFLQDGTNYTVKISETQGYTSGVSEPFTIGTPNGVVDPEIEFTNPNSENGLQQFNPGETIEISWIDNIPDRLIMNMYEEGSATPRLVNSNLVDGTQSYSYTFPNDLSHGKYRFRLAYNVNGYTVHGVNSDYVAVGVVPINISAIEGNNQRSQSQDSAYELQLTPNGQVMLLEGDYSNSTVELLDEGGQTISTYDNQQSSILISTENLSAGNYFLSITHSDNPNLTLKINLN